MQFSLKKLALCLSAACVVALAIGHYVNSPERRVRLAGIYYNRNLKGAFLHSPDGGEFDDDTLAEIVTIAADFAEPHAIGITGDLVTNNGFKIFDAAPNISSIWMTDMAVSDGVLEYLAKMPDLVYLRIENCPNLTESAIHNFKLANPKVETESQ